MCMRIAVCDDEPLVLEYVKRALDRLPEVDDCQVFSEPGALLDAVREGQRFGIVIMDIEWNGKEAGITAAEQLGELDPDARIIYMTGYTRQYVQQIFLRPANLSGFLMKPVDEALLREHVHKAMEEQETARKGLLVKSKSTMVTIRFDSILYLESAGHVVTIHTQTENHSCYDRLEKVLERLPESFLQCHKSYIVNLNEIQRIEGNRILMTNGTEIPISKSRYGDTRSRDFRYMEGLLFSEGKKS